MIRFPGTVKPEHTVWRLNVIPVSSLSGVAFLSFNMFLIATQLSFAMSEWYEANKRDAQACSFAGNGTVNAKASTASSAAQVLNACLATATSTFVPTTPTAVSPGTSGSGNSPGSPSSSGSGSKSSGKSGEAPSVLVSDARSLLGVFLMLAISVASGLLSLV